MVRIRLRRVGAKKQASYRVVVADSRSPRDGRFIERVGWYNPRTDPPSFEIDEGRVLHWLSLGAQASDAVIRLLKKAGTLEKLERVRTGATIDEVLAKTAEAAPGGAGAQVSFPTEEEIAAEEPDDETEDAGVSLEAEEAFEDSGGEEEDETV
ncbi:MAG: 30S ribosomal protein S16 [Chloroflexota bacterium]